MRSHRVTWSGFAARSCRSASHYTRQQHTKLTAPGGPGRPGIAAGRGGNYLASIGEAMFRVFCDETWTADSATVRCGYYVYYGVMVEDANEGDLIRQIEEFRRRRGLLKEDMSIEVKWQKVEAEWKDAQKRNRRSRYEEFLDLFFDALRERRLSFGYLFLPKAEYTRVEASFSLQQPDSKHNFFFMLYFQFLYHCFIRTQVKHNPCQIFIDSRDMGAEGRQYDIDRLRQILNRRLYRDAVPRNQLWLSAEIERRIAESIQIVDLSESKDEPLIQLADLCAGCVRFVLENELPAPSSQGQLCLFEEQSPEIIGAVTPGRRELTTYFYRQLRAIDRYRDINLLKPSYHHRFNIFPVAFSS